MKTKIFYVVRGQFYRSILNAENPVKLDRTFKDENPILARKAAFLYFQDYLDLLLLAKGKTCTTYKQTVADLQDFFNSYSLDDMLNGRNSDVFCEISLSMVINAKVEFVSSENVVFYNDEIEIHGISKNSNDFSVQQYYFNNLRREASIYKERKIVTGTNIAKYDISPLFEDPDILEILNTPINFNDMISDFILTDKTI